MPTEIPNHASDAPRTVERAPETSNLSQAAFADPQDFLTTLQLILPKANPVHPDNVSKSDLIAYSKNGENEKERAAAAVAVDHFDQLRQMPPPFTEQYKLDGKTGLNGMEVRLDLDMATGDLKSTVDWRQGEEAVKGVEWGTGTLAALVGAGLSFDVPPISVALCAAAGVTWVNALHDAGDAIFAQQQAEEKSSQDRSVLASWPEINGDHLGAK